MVGCHRGFVARLKEVAPDALAVHCVIHRPHLVAKRLSRRLNESLQLFRRLCEENDEVFSRLLLHTEVRWLSKEEDPTLRDYLRSRETDIAYLADLYFKFNEMNAQLQKDELSLIRSKSIISAFMSKLVLYKQNLSRGELGQFPNLNKAKLNDILKDSDIDAYCDHLQMLHDDFQRRFHDLLSMAVPSWAFDPFKNAADAELHLQEELLDLQSNDELKPRMAQGYDPFWLQKQVPSLYPSL